MNWQARLDSLSALDRQGAYGELAHGLERLPAEPPPAARASLAYWRGKLHLMGERHDAAVAALVEALAHQPGRAHSHYLLGVALARQRRWCDAAGALQQALSLQPDLAVAAAELGQVQQALGAWSAARQAFDQALALQLGDPLLLSKAWGARVRQVPLAQAPALITQALAGPSALADSLMVEWLQIAGGLLLAGLEAPAAAWLAALQTPGPSLQACSQPLPRRPALILAAAQALQAPPSPAAEAAAVALAAALRGCLWLPISSSEQRLRTQLLSPVQQQLQGRRIGPLSPARQTLHDVLGQAMEVVSAWLAAPHAEPEGAAARLKPAGQADSLLLDLLSAAEDLPRHLQLWPQLFALPDVELQRLRPRLQPALDRLSALLLDRPNRLVLHPDPGLQRQALVLRAEALALLQLANQRLAALTPARPPRTGPCRRWLLLASDDLPQCFLYRVEQKQQQLTALGADCRLVLLPQLDDWAWSEQLLWADAVIVCRLPALQPVLRAIAAARRAGLPVLYDIDDLIFSAEHCPPPLATYGGTLEPERHRRFALDVPLFAAAMRACEGVIVSTATLARHCTPQPAWVLPNLAPPALRQALRPPRPPAAGEPLRLVLASGTTAHKQAWQEELAPALAVLLQRHPQLRLDLQGHLQLPLVLQPFAARIRCRPFCDYPTYLKQLAEAAIGLVVLEPGEFTDAKSAIRWMEFSYLGLAAVLSPTRTYTELLQPGRHARFARGPEAWITEIEALLADPTARLAMAREAQALAQRCFGPEQACHFWQPWLEGHTPARGPVLQLPSPRRRLLITNVFFAPQSLGGATRVVQDHVAALLEHASERYAVTVLCSDHEAWQPCTDWTSQEEPWRRIGPLAADCHDWHGARVVRLALPPRSWREHHDASMAAFSQWWLAQERFDLIHAHCLQVLSVAPLQAARALGIPYAVTLHDGWWLSPRQFLITASGQPVDPADPLGHYDDPSLVSPALLEADRRRRIELEQVLAGAAARLAVSDAFAELYRSAGIAAVEVMENRWQPMPAAGERLPRQPGAPLRACFVGGMALHKGMAVLQAALLLADLPPPGLRLTVVDASLQPQEGYSLVWGSTPVQVVPSVPMQAMAAFYGGQDVLLAPSTWPESYGLVTREALSAGLWVVASDIGALADPIRHGENGHRIPPRDPRALAAVLEQLCACPPCPQPLLAFRSGAEPLHAQLEVLYERLLADAGP